jgi:plastocyanin
MHLTRILASSLFAVVAFGAIVSVDVGEDGLVYNPDTIIAAPGDQVQFTFYPQVRCVRYDPMALLGLS